MSFRPDKDVQLVTISEKNKNKIMDKKHRKTGQNHWYKFTPNDLLENKKGDKNKKEIKINQSYVSLTCLYVCVSVNKNISNELQDKF